MKLFRNGNIGNGNSTLPFLKNEILSSNLLKNYLEENG
jgi:hypothetical protein